MRGDAADRILTVRRLRLWGTGLLVLSWFVYLYVIALPGPYDRAGRVKGSDYVQFYVMGSFVLEGHASLLYDPAAHLAEGRRRVFPGLRLYAEHPNYGPQVALAFAPLARLPYGRSLALFLLLMIACYAAAVHGLWRGASGLRRSPGLVAILAAASPLLFASLRYAQTTPFALLLWAAALAALGRDRRLAAGFAIGCLAYKPQLGVIVGLVLLIGKEWRIVYGAVLAIALQATAAWLLTGLHGIAADRRVLWTLMLNPRLVEVYPFEIHSVRGFLQLLIPSAPVVTACFLAALLVMIAAAVRCWRADAPLALKWGEIVLLSVLASPHLITYDLLLLTLPLLVFADWAVRNPRHPRQPAIVALLVLAYFATFSGSLVARFTHVQVSVIVMSVLAWQIYGVATERQRTVAGVGR